MTVVTRFAPSPTGLLHLGHAYAAKVAHDAARDAGGRFLLRIEDLDRGRARPAFDDAIREDLRWLGLRWDGDVWRQSARGEAYRAALDRLAAMDLVYPCFCTRRDIAEAAGAPHGDATAYPGTCRALAAQDVARRIAAGTPHALRLNLTGALAASPPPPESPCAGRTDEVLARKDAGAAYHLAVVVDDAAQGVTLVTRGQDLAPMTGLHMLLQRLLGLPTPAYHHHPLVTDPTGRRLAKRDRDVTIACLRAAGHAPDAVFAMASHAISRLPGGATLG